MFSSVLQGIYWKFNLQLRVYSPTFSLGFELIVWSVLFYHAHLIGSFLYKFIRTIPVISRCMKLNMHPVEVFILLSEVRLLILSSLSLTGSMSDVVNWFFFAFEEYIDFGFYMLTNAFSPLQKGAGFLLPCTHCHDAMKPISPIAKWFLWSGLVSFILRMRKHFLQSKEKMLEREKEITSKLTAF